MYTGRPALCIKTYPGLSQFSFDSTPASCMGDSDPGDLSESQFMNNSHSGISVRQSLTALDNSSLCRSGVQNKKK